MLSGYRPETDQRMGGGGGKKTGMRNMGEKDDPYNIPSKLTLFVVVQALLLFILKF